MKNFKFTLKMVKIILGVFVTISLYVTFTQPAFQDSVSVNFLLWKSPEIPVYAFIIVAFVVALVIGLFMAGVDHWSMARQMREVINENSELTDNLSAVKRELLVIEEELAQAQEALKVNLGENPSTGSQDVALEQAELSDEDIDSIE